MSVRWASGADGLSRARELRGGPVAASGDLNGDGYDDLVTGEPKSRTTAVTRSPAASSASTTAARKARPAMGQAPPPRYWTQDSPGVAGVAEYGDGWGTDLSLGDTDGDGYADLAIGAPGEDIGSVADAGALWVLRGSPGGLTTVRSRDSNQNSPNVPGAAEKGDRFGGQVRLVDPNRDGKFGLLAAAPGSWSYGGGSLGAPSTDAQYGAAIDD
ncbi:FG-GAP repeat protein [Streptomyces scopuliridis]|uniref:FG-GAP repeat protein n=1 Tax=Streptomyces scopuliridis TaxID=452529 RepID=UPI0036C0FB46